MWTIGYINYIKSRTAYITYTHVDTDVPYHLHNDEVEKFVANQIIFIKLEGSIIRGCQYYDIVQIQDFDESKIGNIQYIYQYQRLLVDIRTNNYITDDFLRELKKNNISSLLRNDFLNEIIEKDFYNGIINHIETTNIQELLSNRIVRLVDICHTTRDGEDRVEYFIESTDYKDSYLNKLLKVEGSYAWLCVNNSLQPKVGETLEEATIRLEKESAENAIVMYSKIDHYLCLFNEIKKIKKIYEDYRNKTLESAWKYLNYDKDSITLFSF